MAKHLDKFTKPFQGSRIPFLLAEVITNGSGEMVDIVFRYLNSPAAVLLNGSVGSLQNQRFTRLFPSDRLAQFSPLHAVAFSGSSASFTCAAPLGQELTITCYQPMYGMAACLLEPRHSDLRDPGEVLAEHLPGGTAVLELSRGGIRCLSFNQHLCDLTRRSRRELLDLTAGDFSALVEPEDWPGLLQELLDAARDSRAVDWEFRLRRKGADPLWINLRAAIISAQTGVTTFYAILLDIDRQRRTSDQFRDVKAQLKVIRSQAQQLFCHLPGSYVLFQTDSLGKTTELLHLSQGLIDLLGYPEDVLREQIRTDPCCCLLTEERESLTAAVSQIHTSGHFGPHPCRVRRQDGSLLQLVIESGWQPWEGGGLLCILLTDKTREQELATGFQIQTQLRDLLLDHSRTISLDYDPASGLARLERFDAAGHRISREIPAYLEYLKTAETIHPDDRRPLAAALRRASACPVSETVEYRGSYDSQDWRWYRVSWASLFDEQGDVYRLVGKAEDVTQQKAAAERFRELSSRYRKNVKTTLASAQLDLTADRILDIKSRDRHLSRVLFGNTAEACLRHLRSSIPDEGHREQFQRQFTPDALIRAFRQGNSHFGLEHRLALDGGASLWVRSMLELAENPETRHLEAFLRVADVERAHRQQSVLDLLAAEYEFVLTVDAASGICRLYGDRPPLPDRTTYRALAAKYIQAQAPSHQRTAVRKAIRMETALAVLETAPVYDYRCVLNTDGTGPRSLRLRWRWLDQENGILLVTLQTEELP